MKKLYLGKLKMTEERLAEYQSISEIWKGDTAWKNKDLVKRKRRVQKSRKS